MLEHVYRQDPSACLLGLPWEPSAFRSGLMLAQLKAQLSVHRSVHRLAQLWGYRWVHQSAQPWGHLSAWLSAHLSGLPWALL